MKPQHALVPLLLASAAVAQVNIIVPARVATTQPPTSITFYMSQLFYSSTTQPPDAHTQTVYDVGEFGTTPAPLQSVSVRRPVGLGNANNAMTANLVMQMSMSPIAFSAATNTFAANHGANIVTTFNGQISLPAASNQPTWPAPWQTPFAFSAPFPFIPANGQSVVVDFMVTGNTATTPWYVEASTRDTGGRASNPSAQSNCRFSNGNYNNAIGHTNPYVGNVWNLTYMNLLPGAPGVAAVGSQGVGGSWNGLPLPIDLSVLGAPGCAWHIDPAVFVPLVANATGTASWPTIPVPNDPSLTGQSFFDHSAWLDAQANAFGLVVGWSSRWIIGSGSGASAATVYATGNNAANPTGTLQVHTAPSLLFQ